MVKNMDQNNDLLKTTESLPLQPDDTANSMRRAEEADITIADPRDPEDDRAKINGLPSVLRSAIKAPDEIITPKGLSDYVSDFKRHCRKTAIASLELGRVVHEARETLTDEEFDQFCEQVGMQSSRATIVKLCCIGRAYAQLLPHADKLPANWTSIYLITQIPAEFFDRFIKSNQTFGELTGYQIKRLISQTKDLPSLQFSLPKDGPNSVVVAKIVVTTSIDDVDYHAIKKALNEVEARLPIEVRFPKAAEEIWSERKRVRYEAGKRRHKDVEFRPHLWDFGKEANATGERSSIDAAVASRDAANSTSNK